MEDTIVAISTSVGEGAISIIRLSGHDALNIASKVFTKDLTKVDSHTIHYGFITSNNEKIDEVLVSVMKAPKTFTREDIVEINCHGGIATTNKVLEVLLENGARLAEPGEFTKRAFLNGRIDLLEAEATMDLISSKAESARKISINTLTGETSNLIKNLRSELVKIISNIEVNIDYPEYEDIEVLTNESILPDIKKFKEKLEEIIKKSEDSKVIKEGIRVGIIGRPNVGKSTLLNELIKTHKDYETEKEVFVKDMLFATLDVTLRKATLPNKRDFLVVDTVGFVSKLPHDLVEAFKATLEEVKYADLILHVIDATNSSFELQKQTTESVLKELGADDKKTIIVYNKIDRLELDIYPRNREDRIYISAKKGINMDILLKMIENALMEDTYQVKLLLPYDKGNIFSRIKEKYNVDSFEYVENGTQLEVSLDEEDYNVYKEYIIEE